MTHTFVADTPVLKGATSGELSIVLPIFVGWVTSYQQM